VTVNASGGGLVALGIDHSILNNVLVALHKRWVYGVCLGELFWRAQKDICRIWRATHLKLTKEGGCGFIGQPCSHRPLTSIKMRRLDLSIVQSILLHPWDAQDPSFKEFNLIGRGIAVGTIFQLPPAVGRQHFPWFFCSLLSEDDL
jgi:hypothetical protein